MSSTVLTPAEIQAALLPTACEWCPDIRAKRGEYLNSTQLQHPDSDQDNCVICRESFSDGRPMIRHDPCRSTYHNGCINNWGDFLCSQPHPQDPIGCCYCTQPMIQTVFPDTTIRYIAWSDRDALDPNVLARVRNFLQLYTSVHAISKYLLRDECRITRDPQHHAWMLRNLRPQANGEFLTHQITPRDSINFCGDIVFQSNTVYAGAITLRQCGHQSTLMMLEARGYYEWCRRLYEAGWDPVTGRSDRRLTVTHYLQVSPLAATLRVMMALLNTQTLNEVELPAVDVARICLNYNPTRMGRRVIIRLVPDLDGNDDNEDNLLGGITSFKAGICVYRIVNLGVGELDWYYTKGPKDRRRVNAAPTEIMPFNQAEQWVRSLCTEVGDVWPHNITIVPIDDDPAKAQYEANLHHSKYSDVNSQPWDI